MFNQIVSINSTNPLDSNNHSDSTVLYLFTNICDDGTPFWNQTLSWDTPNPELTSCFIDIGLSWPPIFLLWLFTPYIIFDYLKRGKNRPSIRWYWRNLLKLFLATILLIVGLIHAIKVIKTRNEQLSKQEQISENSTMVTTMMIIENHISKAHVISTWFTVIAYCIFTLLLFLQRKFGFVNCGLNWFYLLISLIFNSLLIVGGRKHRSKENMFYVYIEFSIQILLFFLCSFADPIPNLDKIVLDAKSCGRTSSMIEKSNNKLNGFNSKSLTNNKKKKRQRLCPKEMASVPNKLTFFWFDNLARKGWRRPLTSDDLWDLPSWNHSKNLFKKFNKLWRHPSYMEPDDDDGIKSNSNGYDHHPQKHDRPLSSASSSIAANRTPKVNLWIMFTKMFWSYFFFPSIARLATDLLQLVNPMVLKFMINFSTNPDSPEWQGIFYSCIFMLTNIFQSLSSAYQQHRMTMLALRMKSVLISIIYRKSLVLAMNAKKHYTTGEIVNLMAVDSQRFTELIPWICYLWTAPIQIAIGLYLLWQELGPSVLGGVILMVATIPINSFVANQVKKIQRNQMSLKDQRLKTISEMLNGMKVLKLYAWEQAFIENISSIRQKELKFIKKSGLISAIFICIGSCSPFLVSMLTFTIYIFVAGGTLDAQKAFVSISLFNLLRIPLIMIPNMISSLILTLVSMKRINRFLNQDETQDYVQRKPLDQDAVIVSNASFSWDSLSSEQEVNDNNKSNHQDDDGEESKKPNNLITLSNISVKIPKNKLIAVVGPVGSGKSSFLYALLGEMFKLHGDIKIDSKQILAYVPQQAWIQNLTLRGNILFGLPYDQKKYEKVIDACALKPDFEMLSGGDQTEIGEKGINLSGGQKQRVSIARACYSNSNLFLFDDPLSAVDSHVGKHIFEEVLSNEKGILKDHTRILVTNALYVLPFVDEVIMIKNGKIEDVGSYENLLKSNESFQDLIKNYSQTNQDDDTEDGDIQLEDGIENGEDLKEVSTQEAIIEAKLLEQMKCLPRSISGEPSNVKKFSRQNTNLSIKSSTLSQQAATSTAPTVKKDLTKLVEAENVETGQISLAVYKKFIAALSPMWFTLILINYIGSIGSSAASNAWLSVWTDKTEKDPNTNTIVNLIIYFCIGFLQVFFVIFGWMTIIFGTMNASRNLHRKLLKSIVHAPMHFFDTTPLGRIINRFSKDIDVLDNYIQLIIRILLNNTFTVVATLVIISYNTPIFLAFVVPFILLYFCIQRFYVSTSRQLKRIESVSRSPIFTHFSETIQGVSTIKAYGVSNRFIEESNRRVDNNQRCYYPSQVANCWLQVRLEFLANCLVFFAALIATTTREGLTGSKIGLSLSYALNVTLSLNWCVRMFAEMENNVVSVERISEYTDVEPEAEWNNEFDKTVTTKWPEQGVIEFQKYATRYRPGLDLVLKEIDLSIKKSEKIGIVGRTGAGKSSLTLALFRIIESSQGKISIDNINISKLGLHKLRSRITIIPQDPVLFCGTLRFNLDPFNNYTDEQLWKVLELSHLKQFVQSLESGLQYQIVEAGENLSVGQRQLVCLSRALLRRTNVLVLDEATAAVDLETDSLIQLTIRKEFSNCTVLTIAHRLHTILDSDRVLVLDAGRVAEFDSPKTLLNNNQSIFYSLAKDAGIVS